MLEEFKKALVAYTKEDQEKIIKAYSLAESLHKGQMRESGEPYIIHPLSVALILMEPHADVDTICAALLHDTLEDTTIKKEEIQELFNEDVARLVDGVTKISKLNFSSKKDANAANTRKIITGIASDVRIIIIKLADRLHNMRTLGFKTSFKQKENSLETMEIFVPLAYYIGAYNIKNELEDLAFRYLKPDDYHNIKDKISLIKADWLEEMLLNIKNILENHNIPNEIKYRIKNIYSIYRRLENKNNLNEIHDLFALKVLVEDVGACYTTLGLVHSLYHPVNYRFKDYISNPKTNKYSSLHTTVFSPNSSLVQTQIRTKDMDKIASHGLIAYWNKNGDQAREVMQEELKSKFQFFTSLLEINAAFGNNLEFVSQVKEELFQELIYVYTPSGEIIELPKSSTVIDFAYKFNPLLANTMYGAKVNDNYVGVDYVLNNKDRVVILTDNLVIGPKTEWEDIARTTIAKKRIRECRN